MLAHISLELLTVIFFAVTLVFILIGNPISYALMGGAALIGVLTFGSRVFDLFQTGIYVQLTSYSLLAVPLFVFMGNMIESTGITKRMFDALYVWMGNVKGGLIVVTIIIGTILAACVGVIAASITMLGLIGLPMMMERKYNKQLACGSICASGSLGILIPPSIMLVMYGPAAGISVGKLFMGAFMPGLMLSALYIIYNLVMCGIKPSLAPAATEKSDLSLVVKIRMLFFSLVPPLLLIFAVLGAIMFGVAAPTEAGAVGALASILLAIGYKSFTKENLKKALISTAKNYAMVQMIAGAAKGFTVLFLKLGCASVIRDFILYVPGGRWASFGIIMLITFVLGMFIDWIGIILIMIPIVTPFAAEMGFDPLWFAMMIIINLQLSFITPPFAYAIFFLRSVLRPEWGITSNDIIKGIIPYLAIICLGLVLCIVFPGIITFLPNLLIGK